MTLPYISGLFVGALILAVLFVDGYMLLLSKLLEYIRYRGTDKGQDGYPKVRDTYYIQSLHQWVNARVIGGLNLFNSLWRRRKPFIKTPDKSDGDLT